MLPVISTTVYNWRWTGENIIVTFVEIICVRSLSVFIVFLFYSTFSSSEVAVSNLLSALISVPRVSFTNSLLPHVLADVVPPQPLLLSTYRSGVLLTPLHISIHICTYYSFSACFLLVSFLALSSLARSHCCISCSASPRTWKPFALSSSLSFSQEMRLILFINSSIRLLSCDFVPF